VARKPDASIRAAAQALAPASPIEAVEPDMPWGARQAAYKRAAERFRSTARAHPRPQPLEHWRRVLTDPSACALAKQMAREAIEELEGRRPTEERISIDAEIQETARRIAKQLGEEEHDPRPGTA
jgi:hypothetical protein